MALGSVGAGFFGALAPEAGNVWDNREKITQFTWSSPATNKLLLEAGFSQFASRFGGQIPGGALTDFIPVQEQSTLGGVPVGNFTYRGWASAGSNEQFHNVWRASGTYVTGAHSLKFGYQAAFQVQKNFQNAGSQLSYIFNTQRPDSDHAARRAVLAEQPHAVRRLLRPGSMDARPADRAGGRAIRARVELVP